MTLILQGTDNSVSSPAVQGGTAGTTTGIYYPAANQVGLASNGTKALVLASSGLLNAYNNLNMRFYTGSEGNYGFIRNNGATTSNSMEFGANGVVMRLDDNYAATFLNGSAAQEAIVNQYGVGLGTATPSSGIGITFPATQSASSNANTLDDYEEGTWTPVIKFGSTTATLTSSSASYTKVGRVVTLMIEAYVTNLNGGTGGFSLTNFPFNAYSYNRQTVAQFYFQFMSASFPAGDKFAFIQPNDSTLAVNYFTGSSGTAGSLDNTHFTTSSYVYASIIYFTP